jgi:hypothetical protein
VDPEAWFADEDEDSYGDPLNSTSACEAPSGYVSDSSDCDDGNGEIYPGADEHCDGNDEDCDGADDNDAVDMSSWYADDDGDSFGDSSDISVACSAPTNYVADNTDCDDGDIVAQALARLGFGPARVFKNGWEAWKAARLPVERAQQ